MRRFVDFVVFGLFMWALLSVLIILDFNDMLANLTQYDLVDLVKKPPTKDCIDQIVTRSLSFTRRLRALTVHSLIFSNALLILHVLRLLHPALWNEDL